MLVLLTETLILNTETDGFYEYRPSTTRDGEWMVTRPNKPDPIHGDAAREAWKRLSAIARTQEEKLQKQLDMLNWM